MPWLHPTARSSSVVSITRIVNWFLARKLFGKVAPMLHMDVFGRIKLPNQKRFQ